MDPVLIAAFVSFFALLVGCLIAPTGSGASVTGMQQGPGAAD